MALKAFSKMGRLEDGELKFIEKMARRQWKHIGSEHVKKYWRDDYGIFLREVETKIYLINEIKHLQNKK